MIEEPEISPDDTQPNAPVDDSTHSGGMARFIGIISVIVIFFVVVGVIIVLLRPTESDPAPDNNISQVEQLPTSTATLEPEATGTDTTTEATQEPDTEETTQENDVAPSSDVFLLPTISPDERNVLLSQPIENLNAPDLLRVDGNVLEPFTIIPDRPRNQVIEYTIQRGDTVFDIAQMFGISQESIAWSNDRRQMWLLTPGTTLNIPPEDGVVHVAVGETTVREIAALYEVDDPYIVIDSEYNQLFGYDPDLAPPSGMEIFIPGGVAEAVSFEPPALEGSGSGTASGGSPDTISFETGAPGSCGQQPYGSGTAWGNPMTPGTYTITRGFSSWHQGIDLASSTGTPIYAANGGRVIFAGRSNWGYGNAVVISHGPFTTLYGHMSSVNVSCGQIVGTGQLIGLVGSTGNSSGPHLHFEILYGNTRTNPASTLAF